MRKIFLITPFFILLLNTSCTNDSQKDNNAVVKSEESDISNESVRNGTFNVLLIFKGTRNAVSANDSKYWTFNDFQWGYDSDSGAKYKVISEDSTITIIDEGNSEHYYKYSLVKMLNKFNAVLVGEHTRRETWQAKDIFGTDVLIARSDIGTNETKVFRVGVSYNSVAWTYEEKKIEQVK